MEPVIIKDILTKEEYLNLINNLPDPKQGLYDVGRSRYMIETELTTKYAELLQSKAREIFKSNTLLKSYSLYCKYFGKASMDMHKDDNACTYTIDLCVRQSEPWELWVEGKGFTLNPNEALFYLGNDQLHGRYPKDLGNDGSVEMMFFHYVEPTHWYFTRNR